MAAVAFDTLEFVETLQEAGVPDRQAKAFSIVVRKSYEGADLATKHDIMELRHEISDLRKQDIAELHHKISDLRTQDIAELRHEIGDLRKDVNAKHESLRYEISDLRKDMGTKHDALRYEISDLRKDVDTKHESLRTDMWHKMKEMELRLTIKLGTIVVASAGALPLLFKFLHLS